MRSKQDLKLRYSDSPACDCSICRTYCRRPGWWSVEEAAAAIEAGYGDRMMVEMGPANAFAVLAPAFKGAEQGFATEEYADRGCTFLDGGRCVLHGTEFQPLECRFCHHERPDEGVRCHADIGKQWNSPRGRALVVHWSNRSGFWRRFSGSWPASFSPRTMEPGHDQDC